MQAYIQINMYIDIKKKYIYMYEKALQRLIISATKSQKVKRDLSAKNVYSQVLYMATGTYF